MRDKPWTEEPVARNFQVGKTQQGADYEEILRFGGAHMVRVRIHCDHYKHQSNARVEVWNNERGWLEVYSIPGFAMRTELAYQTNVGWENYSKDREELLRVARYVLVKGCMRWHAR